MLEGSILQQLATAHLNGKTPLNLGVYYKNTLVALCHALEDCILTSNSQPLVVTAFQRGKWYLQEAERYHSLAQKSSQVVIMAAPDAGFAEHPTSQLPNVDTLALEANDPVAQEWHLIIFAPTYTAMVLCQELSEADYGSQGKPTVDLERKFYGFWTFEPALVQETVEIAIAHISKYNHEQAQKLKSHVEAIAEARGSATPDDLNQIVSKVVEYLQVSQEDVSHIECLHHQELDNNLLSNELQAFLRLGQLIDTADTSNPMAASVVAGLAETMGQLLDLPAWQIKRLRLAGLLYRIAPPSYSEQYGEAPSCPLVPAAQVLRTMPQLRAIAQIINHLFEWWNGSGSPAGLAQEEIPLESRILGLIVTFGQRVVSYSDSEENRLIQALTECKQEQGSRWEPKLVDTLELLVMGLQQGLNLPTTPIKITSGMWLIDSRDQQQVERMKDKV